MKIPTSRSLRRLGPGLIVTAAFIGPGTVTTASKSGADFGFALLWVVVFAVITAVILQEMSARLGLVGRRGLGQAIRETFQHSSFRWLVCLFVLLAIGFGNAAYQTGNLTGAAVGLDSLFATDFKWWPLVLGALAFGILFHGSYRWIERILIGLVALMSLVFLLTAILANPPWGQILRGLLIPSIPTESLTAILGLIGTTVVPYNLFLHSDSVREKWPADFPVENALPESRWDTSLSIAVGGIITVAIAITASVAFFGSGESFDLLKIAVQLEPTLGPDFSRIAFALGLFAAGLTSSITAPLAAAYAVSGILGWERDLTSWRCRIVWMIILLFGVLFAILFGNSPAQTILVAQVANGLLLPAIAIFLLVVVNRSDLMGSYKNTLAGNLLGVLVVLIAAGLGTWKILLELQKFLG